MPSTIITKNSSTASSVPSAGSLTQGELAVNVTDKRLFTKDSGGTVVELGTNPSSLTMPNGTANGLAFLNASKVVTSGSALTFDGSNLGLGVTPSAWDTLLKSITVTSTAVFSGQTNAEGMRLGSNWYYNSGFKYQTTGYASRYDQASGGHSWLTAASGTAGNAITFTQAMTLNASGTLLVGLTDNNNFAKICAPSIGVYDNNAAADGGVYIYRKSSSPRLGAISSFGADSGLVFETNNAGTTAERARIDSSGRLLVNTTTSPDANLQGFGVVTQNAKWGLAISAVNRGYLYSASSDGYPAYFLQGGSVVGSIFTNSSGTSYNTSSDYRLKNVTGALTGYKERLMSLQPKQGTWNVDGSEFRGFVAHDFANQYPKSVVGEKDAVDSEGKPIYQGMQASSSEVMADLVALVQEQQAIIESLKARLDAANL